MKADILRRAEAISSDEEEEEYEPDPLTSKGKGQKPSLGMDIGPDEDDEIVVPLRIAGDGEDSGDEDDDDDDDGEDGKEEEAQTPETIVELAYLRDSKLFDRDAATRRSKTRADLKAQTGMLPYDLSLTISCFFTNTIHQVGATNNSKDGG